MIRANLVPNTIDPDDERGRGNKLFNSWVNVVDISRMLESRDLQRNEQPVLSILDSTVLGEIAADVLPARAAPATQDRAYLADPLHILLTVTNLRGIPYCLDLRSALETRSEMRRLYADDMHFAICRGATPGTPEDALRLEPGRFDLPEWQALRESALATSAFPFGLAPRPMTKHTRLYANRPWPIPVVREFDTKHYQVLEQEVIPPLWPTMIGDDGVYPFLSVDGGATNNCPFDHARRILADGQYNPRGATEAIRAVILIDPFPAPRPRNEVYSDHDLATFNLAKLPIKLVDSLIGQCRFRPEELIPALDETVFSRFLIAPDRGQSTEMDDPDSIACGSLHGFGGFLSRSFREHDYRLGRRNCQRFLDESFSLPEEHPLFAKWPGTSRATTRFRDKQSGRWFLPIIPRLGSTMDEEKLPAWPTLPEGDFQVILNGVHPWAWERDRVPRPGLRDRIQAVFERLSRQNIAGGFSRWALSALWSWSLRSQLMEFIEGAIREDLEARGLMVPGTR